MIYIYSKSHSNNYQADHSPGSKLMRDSLRSECGCIAPFATMDARRDTCNAMKLTNVNRNTLIRSRLIFPWPNVDRHPWAMARRIRWMPPGDDPVFTGLEWYWPGDIGGDVGIVDPLIDVLLRKEPLFCMLHVAAK